MTVKKYILLLFISIFSSAMLVFAQDSAPQPNEAVSATNTSQQETTTVALLFNTEGSVSDTLTAAIRKQIANACYDDEAIEVVAENDISYTDDDNKCFSAQCITEKNNSSGDNKAAFCIASIIYPTNNAYALALQLVNLDTGSQVLVERGEAADVNNAKILVKYMFGNVITALAAELQTKNLEEGDFAMDEYPNVTPESEIATFPVFISVKLDNRVMIAPSQVDDADKPSSALGKIDRFFRETTMVPDMYASLGFMKSFNKINSLLINAQFEARNAIIDSPVSSFNYGTREQNQYFRAEYKRILNTTSSISLKGDFYNQFYNYSRNEKIGSGLFDNMTYGGALSYALQPMDTIHLDAAFAYHYQRYPNYLDIIYLYQDYINNPATAGTKDSLINDKKRFPLNNHRFSPQLSSTYEFKKNNFILFDYNYNYTYLNQQVPYDQEKIPNADTKIKENLHDIDTGYRYQSRTLSSVSTISYTSFKANQYYPKSINSVLTLSRNYSFYKVGLSSLLSLKVNTRSFFNTTVSYWYQYNPHLPIWDDGRGGWVNSRKQLQHVFMLTLSKPTNLREYVYLTPGFSYKHSQSNSDISFYNYNVFEIKLTLEYRY